MKNNILFSTMLLIVIFGFNAKAQYSIITDFTGESAFSGANPLYDQNLTFVGDYMYGMTFSGGLNDNGVVFKINISDNTYAKVLDFNGIDNGNYPEGSLISDGTYLYGMTCHGGFYDSGVVFKISINDNLYTKILEFDGVNGKIPEGSLTSDGTFLYGMTGQGGVNNKGVVFKINISDNTYTKILDFNGTNGELPVGPLISDENYLYGTTIAGGINNVGVAFKIKISDNTYTKILDFEGITNGSSPYGAFLLDGSYLYGTTSFGGSNDSGVIFKINISDNTYTKILDFDNIKGYNPYGSLISDGIYLYGTTSQGGTNDFGVIFKLEISNNTYTKIFDFNDEINGRTPFSSIILDNTFLYGMTFNGGKNNSGVVFKLNISNNIYSKIFDFGQSINGGSPRGALISDNNFLYGMTHIGGYFNKGVAFKINISDNIYTKILDFDSINGSNAWGNLISDGTYLYGMAYSGGANDSGVVFKINISNNTYTKILDFDGISNGCFPYGSLISDGTYLYGMTAHGGLYSMGVVFKIKISDNTYTKILDFDGVNGQKPEGSLFSDGTYLYGLTSWGGLNNSGVVFKIKISDNTYTKILDFGNTDGYYPLSSFISDGTYLYGTTVYGGLNDWGIAFKIKISDNTYTKIFDFGDTDGIFPSSLISDGTYLYGTTFQGGDYNMGVIFKINISDNTYTKILDFDNEAESCYSEASLYLHCNTLYGTTGWGGPADVGTVFKYELASIGVPEINTKPAKNASVYPNPSNGMFTIEVPSLCNATITDVAGRVILNEKLVNIQNSIDISSYAKGVYTLELRNDKQVVNYKLFVK